MEEPLSGFGVKQGCKMMMIGKRVRHVTYRSFVKIYL